MQASSLKFNIYNQKHFSNEPIVLENLIIMSRSLIFSYIYKNATLKAIFLLSGYIYGFLN